MLAAKDNKGNNYSKDKQMHFGSSWQSARNGIASLNSEWSGVKIQNLAENCKKILNLTFTVPVRVVTGNKERRFTDAQNASKPMIIKDKACEMVLSSFNFSNGQCNAELTIKNMKDKGNFGWSSNKFSLEQNHCVVGQIDPYSSTDDRSSYIYKLRSRNFIDIDSSRTLDFVVTSPDETIKKKLKFTFSELNLPK